MKRIVLWALLAAAPLLAQAPAEAKITKLITLRNVEPRAIENMLSMFGVTTVPQDLRDVITQLKGTFTFKEYKMLDVLTLRARAGSSAETSGILNTATPPRMSVFSIRNTTVSEDGKTIRIDRMHAGLRIPISVASPQKNAEYVNSGIDQDVDVKGGQKVVVGRSSLEGPQQALFLILTAHVIQ